MVMVDRACTLTPAGLHYFVERFNCMPSTDCTGVTAVAPYLTNNLLVDPALFLCLQCDSVCDGCTGTTQACNTCVAGSNRVKTVAASPSTCVCDAKYVEVNKEVVCKKCYDLIPGCDTCSSATYCTLCAGTTFFDPNANSTHRKCVCPTGTYLVTGICLSYPGCLEANIYITG